MGFSKMSKRHKSIGWELKARRAEHHVSDLKDEIKKLKGELKIIRSALSDNEKFKKIVLWLERGGVVP